MEPLQALRASCIVLAAGASTRMGSPKQLLDLKGKPLFIHALETALASCKQVILVQGAVDLSDHLPETENLHIVTNRHWKTGMLGSLQTGLTLCRYPRVFVVPADLPLVRPRTYYYLAEALGTAAAAYPVCNGRRGHPVLLSTPAVSLITGADPELKAMNVIAPLRPLAVDVQDPGIYTDIDTPGEWETIRSMAIRDE